MRYVKTIAFGSLLLIGSACSTDGGPVIISDTDHEFRVGGALSDSKPLAVEVRSRLKNNGQTALANIQVSSPSEDTVRLSGSVDDSATLYEAERVAYQVAGVRFVVNTLEIRN